MGIQPTGLAITTIRMDTAITRTDTTDLIGTTAITTGVPTITGTATTATIGTIITIIATNVAWKTNSTELARMRFRASSFLASYRMSKS